MDSQNEPDSPHSRTSSSIGNKPLTQLPHHFKQMHAPDIDGHEYGSMDTAEPIPVPRLILSSNQQQQLAELFQWKQHQDIQEQLLLQHYQQQILQQGEFYRQARALQESQLKQRREEEKRLREKREKEKRETQVLMQERPKIKVEPSEDTADEEVMMDQDDGEGKKPKVKEEQTHPQAHQEMTSSEVKQRLQEFVLNKQQRDIALSSLSNQQFKRWNQHLDRESEVLGPLGAQQDINHFPLRKTASEPNLKVKSRLKAKVTEHRSIGSPLLPRRRDRANGNRLHRSLTSILETSQPRINVEPSGNEPSVDSNPCSPSLSASPHCENSSPVGGCPGPGSGLGHSLPNLQAIPRMHTGGEHPYHSRFFFTSPVANHQSVASSQGLCGIPNKNAQMELRNKYIKQALSDGIEEEDENNLSAVAQRQAQLKALALAQAEAQMQNRGFPSHLKMNSVISRTSTSPPTLNATSRQSNSLPRGSALVAGSSQASVQATNVEQLKPHRPLRQTLSAPSVSISNNVQLQHLKQKQNQQLLQQQHLMFLQQQEQQKQQLQYIQQLQQELLFHQLSKQKLQQIQQKQMPKESHSATAVLKEHIQQQMQQKEQQQNLKEYFMHLQQQQLLQQAREREKEQEREREREIEREREWERLREKERERERELEWERERGRQRQIEREEETPSPPITQSLKEREIQELRLIQQLKQQDQMVQAPHSLQHQQLLQIRQAELAAASLAGSSSPGALIGHRPLSRAHSSPIVGGPKSSSGFSTGLVYDTLMLKHQCTCGNVTSHPEHPGRLQSIWARLQERGVVNRCDRVRPRKATLKEILTVHSEQHTMLFGGSTQCRTKTEDGQVTTLKCFNTLQCGGMGVDGDTIWNEVHSANAARMAVGCMVELAFKVASEELKNGMAIVRPPGHHAEAHQAMGFCYFNNVAIAARLLRLEMSVERVLIVDWDIHHGNGTQQMFYDDPHVLYISVHRHDDATFFPGTGKSEECGAGIGVGYNVNVAWSGGLDPEYGDAEYFAAFRSVVLPIAREFQPDIILVSAGFDAAAGHSPQLGGYKVTAACYAYLTKELLNVADGRVVMALEGGYSLPSLCDASELCVKALLGDKLPDLPPESTKRPPNPNAVATLEKTINIQAKYWNSVKRTANQISHSVVEAQMREKEEADTVTALASLSVTVDCSSHNSEKSTDVPMEDQDA